MQKIKIEIFFRVFDTSQKLYTCRDESYSSSQLLNNLFVTNFLSAADVLIIFYILKLDVQRFHKLWLHSYGRNQSSQMTALLLRTWLRDLKKLLYLCTDFIDVDLSSTVLKVNNASATRILELSQDLALLSTKYCQT